VASDPGMIVLLQPRSARAYGQDFLGDHLFAVDGFDTLFKENGVYPIDAVEADDIVVGQNSDDAEESRALNRLGRTNNTAVFVHCQWDYYDERQKANIAQAMETAAMGITPARFSADMLRRMFPKVSRWKTLDGCIDTRLFHPSTRAEREAWRREQEVPDGSKLVLFTGRLEAAKGITILEQLCAAPDRAFTVMVQYPASENVREKKVLFQSYQDVCQRLSRHPDVVFFEDLDQGGTARPVRFADLVISPSLSEVQPLVLLEALASGVPYIGTDSTPGYRELKDRFSGSAVLASAIELVALPPELRQGANLRSKDIGPDGASEVARRLARAIARTAPPDDAARAALSEAFLAHGFTVPFRLRKFREALEELRPEPALL